MAVSEFGKYAPSGVSTSGNGRAEGAGNVATFGNYLTGGNAGSTENGWNTPFYQTFIRDYQAAVQNRTADNYFLNRKTGIAWADQTGKDDQGQDQVVKAGDVFDNGRKVGNMYEQYGVDHTNQILSRFWVDPDDLKRVTSQAELNNLVSTRQTEDVANKQAVANRNAFDAQVAKQKDEWGDTMDVASPVAGALGGAAVGAGIGMFFSPVGAAVGAGIGAAVGGIGAYLNRDELEEQAARGEVQSRLADQQGAGSGFFTRIAAWSGFAAQARSPLSNVVHGLADDPVIGWGKGGDNKSAFYEVDDSGQIKRNALWTAADVGATAVGAIGQMGTAVGATTFSAQMLGQIGGKTGELILTGGKSFDETGAEYDSIFFNRDGDVDLGAAAAGVGSLTTDVVQLGIGRGIMRGASALGRTSAEGAAQASGLRGWLSRKADDTVDLAGMKFTKDAAGNIASYHPTLAVVAPSELVNYLGARGVSLFRKGGNVNSAVTADDVYQAALDISTRAKTIPAALINGFGEAGEEALQTLLEPLSHNRQVDPDEVLNAALMGGAAGAGMTLGSRIGTQSAESRRMNQAVVVAAATGRELTPESWKRMSEQEKRDFESANPLAYKAAQEAAQQLVQEARTSAVESVAALEVRAAAEANERAKELKNALGAEDRSYIVTLADPDVPDHAQVTSLNTLTEMFERKVNRLRDWAKLPEIQADAAGAADVEALLNATDHIYKALKVTQSTFYATGATEALQEQIIEKLNQNLANSWEVVDLDDTIEARAVTMMDLRNPVDNIGSFQLLMPQVSMENSRRRSPNSSLGRGDGVIQITLGPAEPMSTDYDGDKLTNLTSILLDRDQWAALRTGVNTIGAGLDKKGNPRPVSIMNREFDKDMLALLGKSLKTDPTKVDYRNAEAVVTTMMKELRARYPFAAKPLEDFEARARAGNDKAKDLLLQDTYRHNVADMQALAGAKLTNEWFAMNGIVTKYLRRMRDMHAAGRTPDYDQTAPERKFAVIAGEMQQSRVRAAFASTTTQTVWNVFKGTKMFRKWQSMNYSPYRSPQVNRPKEVDDAAQWLTQQYLRLSSAAVESKMETLLGKDDATKRVSSALLTMLEGPEGAMVNGRAGLLQMAMMEVQGFNPDTNEFRKRPTAYVKQLLNWSVGLERRKFAGVETEEQKAKWAILEKATPAEALFHVFEAWTARELLGLDGQVFGENMTLGQVLAAYTNQSTDNRQSDIRLLRSHASYLAKNKAEGKQNPPYPVKSYEDKETPITPYQVFVDAVEEVGNNRITWDPTAKPYGAVGGVIGSSSNRTSADFREAVTALQTAASKDRTFDMTSGEAWRNLMASFPRTDKKYLSILQDVIFSAITPAGGTTVNMPDWVYNILTMRPEEAEMVLFRQTLMAGWNQLGPSITDKDGKIIKGRHPDNMSDRMHLLMYRLAVQPSQLDMMRFVQQLGNSTSVDQFISFVNENLRGNEAPYTAWNRDLAEIDPTSVNGAMSATLPTAALRKSIREFKQEAVDRFSKDLTRRQEMDRLDDVAINEIDSLLNSADPRDKLKLRTIESWLSFVKGFRPPLGPSAMVTSIAGAVTGDTGNRTDKGKATTLVAVNGAHGMLNTGQTFGTADERQMDRATAVDITDITMNPTALNESFVLMDDTGAQVIWDGLDLHGLVDGWRNPANRAYLQSIVTPSVYENTANDTITQRFLMEPTIKNLLDMDTMTSILTSHARDQKAIHAAFLEGAAGKQTVQRFVGAAMIYNTASRTSRLTLDAAGEQATDAIGELAEIVGLGASLLVPAGKEVVNVSTGGVIPDATLLDQVREELKAERRKRTLKGQLTDKMTVEDTELLVQLHAINMVDQLSPNPTQSELDAANEANKLLKEAFNPDILRRLIQKFKLPEKPKTMTEADWMTKTLPMRKWITQYISAKGTLVSSAHWSKAMRAFWSPSTLRTPEGLPELTVDEWQELSRIAFVNSLQENTTTTSVSIDISEVDSLEVDDLRWFDPTGNSLLDTLLSKDSPLIQAELRLRQQVGGAFPAKTSDLLYRVRNSFLSPDHIGTYTSGVYEAINQLNNDISASGSPEGIASGGSIPKNIYTEAIATSRKDSLIPEDSMLSKVQLSYSDLTSADYDVLTPTRPGGQAISMDSLLLDYRFAKSVKVNGVELLDAPGGAAGYLFVGSKGAQTSGFRIITRETIRLALEKYAKDNGLSPDSLTTDVEFVHPDDQPVAPKWANNLYFEGVVVGDTSMGSLLASRMLQLGGADPLASSYALGATKNKTDALMEPKLITRAEVSLIEAGWAQDFAGMIRDKAKLFLEPDRMSTGRSFHPGFFNAIVKELKLRTLVKGVDPKGVVHYYSSEQVIDAQRSGKPLGGGTLVSQELVSLSARGIRTLLGEQGSQGFTRVSAAEPTVGPGGIQRWAGEVTEEMLDRMPGLRREGPKTIYETNAVLRNQLSVTSRMVGMNEEHLRKTQQGLTFLAQRRQEIHTERMDSKNPGKYQDSMKAAIKGLSGLEKNSIDVNLIDSRIPGRGRSKVLDTWATEMTTRRLGEIVDAGGMEAAYIYAHEVQKGVTPPAGWFMVYGLKGISSRMRAKEDSFAQGDLVLVDLDTFRDREQDIPVVLQHLINAGVRIALKTDEGNLRLRHAASSYLRDSGFTSVNGSPVIFESAYTLTTPMNERAVYGQLAETHTTDTDELALLLHGNITSREEDSATIFDSTFGQSVLLTNNLIPTMLHSYNGKQFTLPTPAQMVQLRQRIAGGIDEFAKMTVAMSRGHDSKSKIKAEVREALDKAAKLLQNDGLYAIGTEFNRGDILPLYDADNDRLLLYRKGLTAPTREQLAEMFGKYNGNAIYTPKLDPNNSATDGTVVGWESTPKYGLRSSERTPVSAIADKLVIEYSGFKMVPTALPKHLQFKLAQIIEGMTPFGEVDIPTADNKSNYKNMLYNYNSAFEFLGIDFRPDVAEVLLKDRSRASEVDNLLGNLHRALPKLRIEAVDSLIKQGTIDTSLRNVLSGVDLSSVSAGVADLASALEDTSVQSEATRITRAIITYLMYERSEVEHVLSSAGVTNARKSRSKVYCRRMPELFTNAFDGLPQGDPLRIHLHKRLQNQLAPLTKTVLGKTVGAILQPDFSVHWMNEDSRKSGEVWLQFPSLSSAGPNPTMDLMAGDRTDAQKYSESQGYQANMTVNGIIPVERLKKSAALFSGESISKMDSTTALFHSLRDVRRDSSLVGLHSYTLAEMEYQRQAGAKAKGYLQKLQTDRWEPDQVTRYKESRGRLATRYGLTGTEAEVIDHWVRQHAGRPTDKNNPDVGRISYSEAMKHLERIEINQRDNAIPTLNAAVPIVHIADLKLLFQANGPGKTFTLYDGIGEGSNPVKSWTDWTHVALGMGKAEREFFDSAFLTPTDGMLHSYVNSGLKFFGLPISMDDARSDRLTDADVSSMLLSVSPQRRRTLSTPEITAIEGSLEEIFGGSDHGFASPTDATVHNPAAERIWSWRKENKVPRDVSNTYKGFLKDGVRYVNTVNVQAAPLRIAMNMRAFMAMLNPMMYVSAPIEMMAQEAVQRAAEIITGETTRGVGALRTYSAEDRSYFRKVDKALGLNSEMRSMINQEFAQDSLQISAGRLERATSWLARFAGRWQDPYYGAPAEIVARRYRTALIEASRSTQSSNLDAKAITDRLVANPSWAKINHPALHRMAMASLKEMKNIKATPLTLLWRSTIEPLSTSPRISVAWPATLVKMQSMFAGYGLNKLVQVTGMQGVSSAAALFLHGRKKGAVARIFQRGVYGLANQDMSNVSDTYDMSEVLESLDLTTDFLKSGLTHSGLFVIGMSMGGLGLTGEDEEDRRRRRAAKLTGESILYDPRDVANDFRNSDTIYLDNIPILKEWFKVSEEQDGVPGRSMAHMNWVMKSVMSPLLGMERFFDSGNPNEILWGFQDAVGSLPLVSTMRWDDAVKSYAELMKSSENAAARGGPEDLPIAFQFILSAVMNFERMLLESSFINSLYVGWDKYDRDPWAMPEVVDGQIVRDRNGVPQPTSQMQEYKDADGNIQMGYQTRNWFDAQIHALTENRATAALIGQLVTGLQGDFLRTSQVAKIRTFKKQELNPAEAEAVIRSIWKGGVDPKQIPGLENRFIDMDVRKEVQATLIKEINAESKAMGLNEYQSTRRLNEIWYGPRDNPDIQGLYDIIFSAGDMEGWVGFKESTKYYQLNTTYVKGSDGKMYATGISRNLVQTLAGFSPLQGYEVGTIGGMAIDGSLNSVDEGRGLNTGARSLEKINDSMDPRKDDDALPDKKLDSTSNSNSGNGWKDYGGSGWKNYGGGRGYSRGGRGYSRGGGSGGSGSFTKLQAPERQQAPYANDVDNINVSNPLLRRASIRREKIDSEKGRIKPWQ